MNHNSPCLPGIDLNELALAERPNVLLKMSCIETNYFRWIVTKIESLTYSIEHIQLNDLALKIYSLEIVSIRNGVEDKR